jgi:hypothetical protein
MAKLEIHIETDKTAGTITISDTVPPPPFFPSSLLRSSLALSDTTVDEPYIRAPHGTASQLFSSNQPESCPTGVPRP